MMKPLHEAVHALDFDAFCQIFQDSQTQLELCAGHLLFPKDVLTQIRQNLRLLGLPQKTIF